MKNNTRRLLAVITPLISFGALGVLCPRQALGDTCLVKDGRPQAEIVIADRPPRLVMLAASELQAYVEKISGAQLAITNAAGAGVPVQIYVGRSAYTDRLKVTDTGLKYGAFRRVAGKRQIILLGRDHDFALREPWGHDHPDGARVLRDWDAITGTTLGNPMLGLYRHYCPSLGFWEYDEGGSLNAVYELLRDFGVRWYMPGELGEIVPKKATLTVPDLDQVVQPDSAMRNFFFTFYFTAQKEDILWYLRLGLNRGNDVMGICEAHGMRDVLPREEMKQAHPEYYALWGGKRAIEGEGKPCLSAEGLFRLQVKYVRALFDHYDEPMVSLMPDDGYGRLCECDMCKGKGTPERGFDGALSDYVWGYVDRVAREVYKTHPNKKVSCSAYCNYLLPPEKIATLSPNLVVGILEDRRSYQDPARRKQFVDMRQAWLMKMPPGGQLMVGNHYPFTTEGNNHHGLPAYFPHPIAEDLRSLKGLSLGEFIEVGFDPKRPGYPLHAPGFNHLNLYVTSRFYWDPTQDVEALLGEYYTLFYGPARDEMQAFIEYSEAHWMEMTKKPEMIDKTLELLAKAQKKVAPGSAYGQRIALLVDFVQPLHQLRDQLAKGRDKTLPEAKAFERSKADITLDGKLDDKFWQGIWVCKLNELQTGQPPYMPTSFRVAWADNALYFGILCEDRDMRNLRVGTIKNDDMAIWDGDCVEILLETQAHSYYQLVINPQGVLADIDRINGINMLWASGAEVAAYRGDKYWSLEVRIPVSGDVKGTVDPLHGVVGRQPETLYPWYINVCRQRVREAGTESSAFSPTGKETFHEVMKFGALSMH